MTLSITIPSWRECPDLYTNGAFTLIGGVCWWLAIRHPEIAVHLVGKPGPDVFGSLGMVVFAFCGADTLMTFLRAQPHP